MTLLSFKKVVTVLVFCCIVVWSESCKKDNAFHGSTTKATVKLDSAFVDSITYWGCNYANDVVTFSFHIAGKGSVALRSFFWDFGDGSGSGIPIGAKHAYAKAGSYVVTLSVNGYALHNTIQIDSYMVGSAHTSTMAGNRQWNGAYNSDDIYTTRQMLDSSLTLEVLNAGQIRFWNNTLLHCTAIDSTDKKMVTYTDCSGESRLYYFFMVDSIQFNYTRQIGKSENIWVSIHTP